MSAEATSPALRLTWLEGNKLMISTMLVAAVRNMPSRTARHVGLPKLRFLAAPQSDVPIPIGNSGRAPGIAGSAAG